MKTHTQQAKRFFATLLFSTLVLVFPTSSAADSYEDDDWYKKAFKELKPLAEQGEVIPQFNLGEMYEGGLGIRQDYAEAVKWYRKATEQGYALAQHNLGHMYGEGEGVPQNYAEAVKWYREAAEQGFLKAQFALGSMYDRGRGVPQDYIEAHKWFNLAATQRSEVQEKARENRDLLEKRMTSAQIAEAQKLAREWKPKLNE